MPFVFAFPWVWLGAGLIAAPVAIHLLLRSRPRRIPFPAIRFVRQSQQATQAPMRLRHLLLLAMRILAIILLLAFLARPRLKSAVFTGQLTAPVAAVFLVDDSASMGYHYRGQTRLEAAAVLASQVVDRLPAGSQAAVITTSRPNSPETFTADRNRLKEALGKIELTGSSKGLGPALQRAYQVLHQAGLPLREVYVATDLAATAWSQLAPGAFKDVADVGTYVLDVGTDEDQNRWLSLEEGINTALSPGSQQQLQVGVAVGDIRARAATVELWIDGRVVDRQSVVLAQPHQQVAVRFPAPSVDTGTHAASFKIADADALDADNERFFWLVVRRRPQVVLLADRLDSRANTILSQMLAPTALPPDLQRIALRRMKPDEWHPEPDNMPAMVILGEVASPQSLPPARLTEYVRAGGHLLVVASDGLGDGRARTAHMSMFGVRIGPISTLQQPGHLVVRRPDHPLLAVFGQSARTLLGEAEIHQVLALQPGEESEVVLNVSGDGAALVQRPLGKGRVWLLGVSPDPAWSTLAADAEGLLVLLARMVELASAAPNTPTRYLVGRQAAWQDPDSPESAQLTILGPDHHKQQRTVAARTRTILPTNLKGHWTVTTVAGPEKKSYYYSVNVDVRESLRERLSDEQLAGLFDPQLFSVIRDTHELRRKLQTVRVGRDITGHVALLLLLLLLAESIFANRFHRQARTQIRS